MGPRRTLAAVAALALAAFAAGGIGPAAIPVAATGDRVSATALLSPFPIVQVTGKVARRGTKLRRLTVIAPTGAAVTARCRGRGCPFRTKTYTTGGTIRIRKLENRLLRSGSVVEISVTSPDAVGKYTRLQVRRGRPPGRSDRCLLPGDGSPVACPATSPSSSFDLSDGSVTSGKLADGAVTAAKIAADAVTAAAIAADAVTASELAAGSVGSDELATDSVGSEEIAANAVGSDEIVADAVTSSEVLDGTLTTADISQSIWSGVHQAGTLALRPAADPANAGYLYFATDVAGGTLYRSDGAAWAKVAAGAAEASIPDGSIDNAKLAPNAVTTDKIAADTIAAADIATGAVDTAEILDSSVTSADIATDTIAAADIATGAVTAAEILDSTVASADIATDTIAAADIATDAVGALEIAADAVGSSEIATGAVGSAEVADDAVTTAEILDATIGSIDIGADTVAAADIATGAVTTAEILDSTIASADIAADTVAAADIATGAVTTAEILDATITSADIAAGTIQTGDLAAGAAGESLYRLVQSRSGKLDRDATSGTYLLPAGGTVGANSLMEEGVDLERDAGVFYLSSADHALSGRTTQLRLRATLLANGTAPGVTVKVGLYPVTANGGGNDRNNVTLGSVVSEVTFSSIGADSRNVQTSADFAFPSTGFYVLGVNTSGTLNNNSLIDLSTDLHVRNV